MAANTAAKETATTGVLTQWLRWVDSAIVAISVALVITALVVMFVSLMAEVVVRYVTNQGMGWPTEVPNILFPWLVMGGIVLGAQRGQHIAVTAIQGWISRGANRALLLAHQVLLAFTFFYLAWVGLSVIEITGGETYPVTGLSAKWAYLAMIAGFIGIGLTALTTLVHLLHVGDPLAVRAHDIEDDV